MYEKKQLDIVRKRNSELSKQIDDLKFKLEFDKQLNREGYQNAKDLIADLEIIKMDWLKVVKELQNYKVQYSILIDDLKQIKTIMINMGFKVPLHKKIIFKIKQKFNKT